MSAIDEATYPERPNKEGRRRLQASAPEQEGDGPVVMLDLLALKPDGGRARYEQYGAAVAPLLTRVGGRILRREGIPPLLGDGHWDLVALVEYRAGRRSST